MAQLTDGVQYLKGIGPAKAKLFEALGIRTIGDLLYHYPRTVSYTHLTLPTN